MKSSIMKQIESFARKYCEEEVIKSGYEDQNLWKNHVQLVRKYAIKLAKKEKADLFVVEAAALLHDIGKYKGRKGHDELSYKLSKDFLNKLDIPKKDLILKCISKHGSEYSSEENEIEVKVLQSADALGTLFDDEWQEHSRKTMDKDILLGLFEKTYKKINLESAKKMAEKQIRKLKGKLI